MNRKALVLIVAVLATAALSTRADPLNLVTNPGFELGSFSGWTNNSTGNFVNAANPHSGTYSAWMGQVGSDGSFQQSIATTPGQLYNVSFWLESPGGTPNDFSASFGGVTFYTVTNGGAFPYTQFMGNITATTASSLLLFSARQDPSYWHVDDVDVHLVPEPGTLGLIALGALGLVGAVRKRRSV
jgi:PEP-CTERM motif-containing protein/carbohydrate binding protein with CBM4/9 domain